jgi:hypothetical protein
MMREKAYLQKQSGAEVRVSTRAEETLRKAVEIVGSGGGEGEAEIEQAIPWSGRPSVSGLPAHGFVFALCARARTLQSFFELP